VEIYNKFQNDSARKAFDTEHRHKIAFNISRYDAAVKQGKLQYANLDLAKEKAAHIKHKAINELEKYLVDFEANFQKHGGKVIWAQDADEALKEILVILKRQQAKNIVKSKTMVTEEIGLNTALEQAGIESLETDLGEYIVQLAGESPYHIVTPAMHKSREDVAALFHEKFGLKPNSTPEQITSYVRKLLREKFFNADVGITGANFLIADIGAIALTENEGNALMSVSFPKVHIAIAGIEKIIPKLRDLDLFWPLLATHGTGQNMTVYNSIISGPRQDDETDGPDEMYLVLLDNNRTELLEQQHQRRALSCIRCGACLNICPVYKTIGGHAYGTTYSGPIGAVITPYLRGMKDYKHLSFASSLCGACTEVCPVKINLHELLLYNRNDSVKAGQTHIFDRFSMFGWKQVMLHRSYMDKGSAGFKNKMLHRVFGKLWGERRILPEVQPKNFKQLWEERMEGKK
jgi:L-lactate dehydrogenase complex protein LldF